MRPVNCLVVGAGMMGKITPPLIRQAGGNVYGVLGIDSTEVERLASQIELADDVARGDFGDYDRFLKDDPNVDAVFIATPNFMHAEMAIKAAQAGKHVFIEKPLATSMVDAENIYAALMDARVAAEINALYRHHEMFGYMKDAITSRRLGTPVWVEMTYQQDWQMDPDTDIGWRPVNEIAGKGKLTGDLGAHVLQNTFDLFDGAEIIDFNGKRYNVHPVRYKLKGGSAETFGGGGIPSHVERPDLYEEMDMLDADKYSGDDIATAEFLLGMPGAAGVRGRYLLDQVIAGHKNDYRVSILFEKGKVYWEAEYPNHVIESGADGVDKIIQRGSAPGITGRPPGHPKGYGDALTDSVVSMFRKIKDAGYGRLDDATLESYTGRNIGDAVKTTRAIARWNEPALIPILLIPAQSQ